MCARRQFGPAALGLAALALFMGGSGRGQAGYVHSGDLLVVTEQGAPPLLAPRPAGGPATGSGFLQAREVVVASDGYVYAADGGEVVVSDARGNVHVFHVSHDAFGPANPKRGIVLALPASGSPANKAAVTSLRNAAGPAPVAGVAHSGSPGSAGSVGGGAGGAGGAPGGGSGGTARGASGAASGLGATPSDSASPGAGAAPPGATPGIGTPVAFSNPAAPGGGTGADGGPASHQGPAPASAPQGEITHSDAGPTVPRTSLLPPDPALRSHTPPSGGPAAGPGTAPATGGTVTGTLMPQWTENEGRSDDPPAVLPTAPAGHSPTGSDSGLPLAGSSGSTRSGQETDNDAGIVLAGGGSPFGADSAGGRGGSLSPGGSDPGPAPGNAPFGGGSADSAGGAGDAGPADSTNPEPASLTLVGTGALALFAYAWRRRKVSPR